mgnify:CR=1 FL=1
MLSIKGNTSILKGFIRSHGSDAVSSLLTKDGWNLGHFAALYRRPQVLRLLFTLPNRQLFLESKTKAAGWTPLHIAVMRGDTSLFRVLVDNGSDISATDRYGRNIMHMAACICKFPPVACYLLDRAVSLGVGVNSLDQQGQTAIHHATLCGNDNIVLFLIQSLGADMSICNANGLSAIALASPTLADRLLMVQASIQRCQEGQGDRRRLVNLQQVIYVGWLLGSHVVAFIFLPHLIVDFASQSFLHALYVLVGLILMITQIIAYYKAWSMNPGVIQPSYATITAPTASLLPQRSLTTRQKRASCQSCAIARPLRSKHCSICGHCVARFDHHCGWLNADVGAGNYRWFLIFIGALELEMLVVLGGLAYIFLFMVTIPWEMPFLEICRYIMVHYALAVYLFVGAGVVGSVIVGPLVAFQLQILGQDITTNEMMNWSHYAYMMNAETGFRNPFNSGSKWENAQRVWNADMQWAGIFTLEEAKTRFS